MLSLDLFDSQYERELREGAVDKLEMRRIEDLNRRMDELMARARDASPEVKAALKNEYVKIKDERDSYYKIREQQTPQQPPAKGLLKGKDLVTPQQRVAGATPQKPGVAGAVKDVVGGVKRWLQGEPDQGPTYEDISEEDDINKFGPPQGDLSVAQSSAVPVSGQLILSVLAKAWDDKLPYVDLPFTPVANVSRGKIYDILITLKRMSSTQFNRVVNDTFRDRSKFLLWSSQLKRYTPPVERPKSPPGQMKLFKETDSQKKNSRDKDAIDSPQNLAVQRYLTKVRRKHPAATSDIEAIAKDELEKQAQTDQTIKDLKAVNRRQDAALKKAMTLDRQQGDEITDIEKQLGRLSQKLQVIKTAKPADDGTAGAPAMTSPMTSEPEDIPTAKGQPSKVTAVGAQPSASLAINPALLPDQDRKLYDKVRELEQQFKQKTTTGASSEEISAIKQQMDQGMRSLQASMDRIARAQQKVPGKDSDRQASIDLFPDVPEPTDAVKKPKAKAKSKRISKQPKKPEDLSLAKQVISKIKNPELMAQPEEMQEHGGGIGPRQHWQDLMQETVTDVKSGMAEIYRRLAPKIERHRDSFLAGQLYDELENYAELHGAEGEFKRMMSTARGRAHMEYDTNPGGFQNWFWFLPFEDNMEEGIKQKVSSAALAACMAAGGTLQGCATNPTVGGTIGTVRDVGTAVKTAKNMTRAGVQDELNQELRNFIRAQGGDPGSQNLSTLYKLQKRMQGQPKDQPNESAAPGDIIHKYFPDIKSENNVEAVRRAMQDVLADSRLNREQKDRAMRYLVAIAMKNRLALGREYYPLIQKYMVESVTEAQEPQTEKDFRRAHDTLSNQIRYERDPAILQILRLDLGKLEALGKARGWFKGIDQTKVIREFKDTPAVERAIIMKFMVNEKLRQVALDYGIEKIASAAEDVAYNVGDVGAIGSSDVNSWVNQVLQIIGARS